MSNISFIVMLEWLINNGLLTGGQVHYKLYTTLKNYTYTIGRHRKWSEAWQINGRKIVVKAFMVTDNSFFQR